MSFEIAHAEEVATARPCDFPGDYRTDYSRNVCEQCLKIFHGARWRTLCAVHAPKKPEADQWQ